MALAFPNRYAVGMSNLGFQSVYGALNAWDEVVCERVFYPEPEDLSEVRGSSSGLLSLESGRPLSEFHCIAFSIPFENDYPNVVEMLAMAGIPHRSEHRSDGHPLVAAGGVAVFLNPEPLSPFMDFFFVGEAEALLEDFVSFLKDDHGPFSHRDAARPARLARLAREVPGVYVPSLYRTEYGEDGTLRVMEPSAGLDIPERVAYRRADLRASSPCRTVILTPNTEFGDVSLLEIGRGCGRGCRFCAAGFVYRPLRNHSAEKLLAESAALLEHTARIGLVGAAVSDHPDISSLCDGFIREGAALSFSSIRADTMTSGIAEALRAGGHKSVAVAPEAGTERLRRVINKNLSMEQILTAAERLTEMDILHLKLYFMIGLPTETPDDLDGIVETVHRVRERVLVPAREKGRLGTVTLSVHSFVPKPFTPFQWSPFAGVKELQARGKRVQEGLRKLPNVRVHFDPPRWAYVQALLSRGDRRVAALVEKTALEGLSWSRVLKSSSVDPDFWVMRERGEKELFPWEIIDHGVERSYLWEERCRALAEKSTPPCPSDGSCRRCGAC